MFIFYRFSEDNEWYRAKIERIQGSNATVFYVDYGNKEVILEFYLFFFL